LVVLQLMGTGIHWLYLLLVIPIIFLLWVFACAIALFTSAIQVFVRDVAQILPPFITFWFFTTPILYSASYLPESIQKIAQWNPMAWFIARLRELLLFGEVNFDYKALFMVLFVVMFFWASLRFFRRFSGHFEDFL
jgi:lipopolysaccharide transport system permease protein